MEDVYSKPALTKIYADVEKEVLLREVENWNAEKTFVVRHHINKEIMNKFKQRVRNGFESALSVYSIDDQNLVEEMSEFLYFPSKFPMTFYRIEQRKECREIILKKVTKRFFYSYMNTVNEVVERDEKKQRVKDSVSFSKAQLVPYENLLKTSGLSELKNENFYENLRKTFIEYYDLKSCQWRNIDNRLYFDFTFKKARRPRFTRFTCCCFIICSLFCVIILKILL
jgi:hypothetical protein